MKSILTIAFAIFFIGLQAQTKVFSPTTPQIIYEMFIESVEPIHVTYDELNLTNSRTHITGQELLDMHRVAHHKLESFHKDRLHIDAFNAALTYLNAMKPIDEELAPILDQLQTASDEELPSLMSNVHDVTIQEKHHADIYRTSIFEVIEMFQEEWDHWLQDEVIYFMRLTANERNKLYESGFNHKGLQPVKRRFYTSEYFNMNMLRDKAETRVESIKASFHDLSTNPDYMVQNVDDFIASVDEPMAQYRFIREEKGNQIIYIKDKGTVLDFSISKVIVTVHSRTSDTVTIEFIY